MKNQFFFTFIVLVWVVMPHSPNPALFTVMNTDDSGSGSLREAVADAIAVGGPATILFDSGIDGDTITLTSGEISLPADLYIKGNGPLNTIIDGQCGGRIFLIDDVDNVYLEGLLLQNGKAAVGGAVAIHYCSPSFTDCGFVANEATNSGFSAADAPGGGAVYNNAAFGGADPDLECSPTFTDCFFYKNVAGNRGGAVYNRGDGGVCSPVFTSCQFDENQADGSKYGQGGAVFNNGGFGGNSSPRFLLCAFADNEAGTEAGAVFNLGRKGISSPTFDNCSFTGNQSNGRGGAVYDDGATAGGASSPVFTSTALHGNYSGIRGGAVYNYGEHGECSPAFINSTLAANRTPSSAGVMYNYASAIGTSLVTFTNSVIWGNSSGILNVTNASSNYTYSLLEGAFPAGAGNLDGNNPGNDPQFVNQLSAALAPTSGGDYRLQDGSPAQDVGNNAALSDADSLDLDSNPRIMDGVVDVGAFEKCSLPIASCKNATVYLDDNLIAVVTPGDVNDGSFAACGIDTIFVHPDTFGCIDFGAQTVTLTVRDFAGKQDECVASITVANDPLADYPCCMLGQTDNHFIASIAEYTTGTTNPSGDNGGYKDFTNINFTTNNPYFPYFYFLFTPGNNGPFDMQNWEVYIDWNENGQFEPGEKMLDYCTSVPFLGFLNLVGHSGGPYRMRVIMQSDSDNDGCQPGELPTDLCGPMGEGEVEDYLVEIPILSQPPAQLRDHLHIVPNPFGEEFLLTLLVSQEFGSEFDYELISTSGRSVRSGRHTWTGEPMRFDGNDLSPGTYFLLINTGEEVFVETVIKQ